MAGKFEKQFTQFAVELEQLYSRAIRRALLAGLYTALDVTKHDSSNAAVHWLLVAKMRSRPTTRRFGKLKDLRQTGTRAATPPVGKRGSMGAQKSRTITFVRDKELREVVDKFVSGRAPETKFALYTSIDPESEYGINANISEAGQAALATIKEIFDEQVKKGKVRVRFR